MFVRFKVIFVHDSAVLVEMQKVKADNKRQIEMTYGAQPIVRI